MRVGESAAKSRFATRLEGVGGRGGYSEPVEGKWYRMDGLSSHGALNW